jgi:hypothetical protein
VLACPKSGSQEAFHLHPERYVAFKRQSGMFFRHILERLFPQWVWNANKE